MALEDWVKGDGARIEIVFDAPLELVKTANPSNFIITSHEYNWVPNGELIEVIKTIKTIESKWLKIGLKESINNNISNTEGVLRLAPDFTKKDMKVNFLNRHTGIHHDTMIVDRKLYLGGDLTKKSLRKPLLSKDEGEWNDTLYLSDRRMSLSGGEE